MRKSILRIGAAIIALVFSLLTIVEGSSVLLGISQRDHVVLMPLVLYNVLMGFVGIVAGVILWLNRPWVLKLTAGIGTVHLFVLLAVGVIFLLGDAVAADSVRAMALRSAVWLAIMWAAWTTRVAPSSSAHAL